MSTGFVLNISKEMINRLTTADEKIAKLAKTSEQSSQRVIQAFQQMQTQGIEAFINSLDKAQQVLGSLNVQSNGGLSAVSEQANKGARAITDMQKVYENLFKIDKQNVSNSAIAKLNGEIDAAMKRLTQLQSQLHYYTKGVGSSLVYPASQVNPSAIDAEVKSLITEINMLQQIRDMERAHAEEKLALATRVDAMRNAQNKANIEEGERENKRYQATLKMMADRATQEQKVAEDRRKAIEAEEKAIRQASEAENKRYQATLKMMADRTKQEQIEAEKRRKANEMAERNRIKNPAELAQMQHAMKTLQQMNNYAKELKRTLSTLDPKSKEFERLNNIYGQTRQKINEIKGSMEGVNQKQRQLLNTADQFKRAFTAMLSVSAIKGYINQIAKVRGEFELQQISLQSLLQNKDKANEIWDKTVQLAIKSPFQVKELVTYTKQLAAYQVESDKLYDTTKRLADISAGLGVDMQRLILAYGQVKAANYLRATELRQFTEAGINMLAELAKYYTEIEKATVTVAQVQERITKRRVSFDDVNEIIQRMTDEGGLFYDMQAKQAETLKGQISNLRDSIDLMLNDIGQENDGVLKNMVALTRKLIENWRGVATVLKLVFGAAMIAGIHNFYRGITLSGRALTVAAAKMNGMVGAAARLKIAMAQLNKTLFANPFIAIAAAITAAAVALWDYKKSIDAANEKYDEASVMMINKINTLEEETKKIEENNAVLKDEASSEEEVARAREENEKVLLKLQQEYPEYYSNIEQSSDGTVSLTKETQKLNKELRIKNALQQASKKGFGHDSAESNYNTLLEAYGEVEKTLAKKDAAIAKLEAVFAAERENDKITQAEYEYFLEGLEQMEKANSTEEIRPIKDKYFHPQTPQYKYIGELNNVFSELKYDEIVAGEKEGDFAETLDRQMDLFRSALKLVEDEGEEAQAEMLHKMFEFLGYTDEQIKEFSWEHVTKEIDIQLNMVSENNGRKTYSERDLNQAWQEKIWGLISNIKAKNPNLEIPVGLKDLATQDLATIITKLRKAFPNLITKSKEDVSAGEQVTGITGDKTAEVDAKEAQKSLYDLAKYVGFTPSGGGGRNDKVAKAVKARISLIKEMNKEYERLNQVMDKTTAKQKVLDAFTKTAKQLNLDISSFTFDDTGTLTALKKLLKNTKRQDLKAEIQKVIDNYEIAIEINANKEQLKKYGKEVDEYFDAYDISKSLDELGVDDSFAKKYFNVDYLDIDTLRAKIEGMKTSYEKLGKDGEKSYQKMLEKVEKLEEKAQKERLKKYLKYANQSIGERAQIKVKELRELAEIEKTFGSEQSAEKTAAQKTVKEKSYQATKKLDWEEFQKSDLFINLFKDLDMASEKLLEHAIKQLNEFKDNWTDIPLEDMRAIIEKVGELESKLAESSPMKTIRTLRGEGFRTGKKGRENMHELQDEQMRDTQTLNSYESEITLLETLIGLKQENKDNEAATYALEQERYDLDSMALTQLINRRDAYKDLASKKKKALENTNKEMIKQKQIVAAYQQQEQALGDAQKMAGDLIDAFSDLAEVLGADSDGIGMTFVNMGKSMMDSVLNTIMLQIQLNAAADAAQSLGAAMNAAMGIVGWIVMAVQLLVAALTAIFQAKDKALQKQIDALAEQTEGLKEKFDELAESIDEVYSNKDLQQLNKDLRESNELLIQNLEAQRALQQQRKQTDEVKDEIKDLDDQIKEAEESLTEALDESFSHATDGIIDSAIDAAQSFVDAWYDAFKETGDGLKGLEENMDEMLLNMVKKQAALAIVGKYTDMWQQSLKAMYENDDQLTDEEIKAWAEQIEQALPGVSEQLKAFFESFQPILGGSGELSGLEEGIAGASEETVQIVAAYLNSIRYFVSDNNALIAKMRDVIVSDDVSVNPMLEQLRIIATNTSTMNQLMESVIHTVGHEKGGAGIKVFI